MSTSRKWKRRLAMKRKKKDPDFDEMEDFDEEDDGDAEEEEGVEDDDDGKEDDDDGKEDDVTDDGDEEGEAEGDKEGVLGKDEDDELASLIEQNQHFVETLSS